MPSNDIFSRLWTLLRTEIILQFCFLKFFYRRCPMINADERRYDKITDRITGSSYDVANILGCGFLEKIYENSLCHLLSKRGFKVDQQYPLRVHFEGILVGEYYANLIVNDCVLVEVKAVSKLREIHEAQIISYLRAANIKIGLLINFGSPKVEVRRRVNRL